MSDALARFAQSSKRGIHPRPPEVCPPEVRGRCYSWPNGGRERCPRPAVGVLYAPDGEPNPGGDICAECADLVITEYAEKLGERWELRMYRWPE